MPQKAETSTRFVVVILVVALVATVSVLLHVMFSKAISNLTVEILAAVLGVVLVVASVGVTIHFQNRSEMERQFKVALFEKKLNAYQQLIDCIARSDDDGVVTAEELEHIRNHSETVALVGGKPLIRTLASFLEDIDEDGKIDAGLEHDSFTSLIQAMRYDVDVEKDDVREPIGKIVAAIKQKGGTGDSRQLGLETDRTSGIG